MYYFLTFFGKIDNMKKVLFLITQAEMGGAQKYVLELALTLQKTGDFKTLIASEKNTLLKKRLAENNIEFFELKNIQRSINPLSDIYAFFEIYKLIKSEKPDIVHANSSKMGVFGAFAGTLVKAPKIVFTAHGWVFNEVLPFWKKWIYVFLSWISALFLDKIICVSNFDKRAALRHKIAPQKKLIVINNGINTEGISFFEKEDAKKKLNLPKEKIIVGTIANFYKNKGLAYLIEAANQIKKESVRGSTSNKDKKIIFVVVGDGSEKENLISQIEKYQLEDSFLLLGLKKDAYKYLKAFDVFVLSSQKEGFPYTLLEAGLAKLPVVTTNVGGIPDLINESNGVSVMSRHPVQMKNAILNLLKDKQKQDILAENLYKDVSEKFTLKKMVDKTKKVYES